MYRFKANWRIGFSDAGQVWEIKYYGPPRVEFREEIATLSTAFVSNRPDGVSLEATSLEVDCETKYWQVCTDTAAAYERGDLDRTSFVDKVYEKSEVVNNC